MGAADSTVTLRRRARSRSLPSQRYPKEGRRHRPNLILGPWYQTELFANFGTGFHSNDARSVVADRTETALPTARGYEFGVRSKVIPRTEVSLTYCVLHLASELVFVGNEGATEARAPSHREGIEFAT